MWIESAVRVAGGGAAQIAVAASALIQIATAVTDFKDNFDIFIFLLFVIVP